MRAIRASLLTRAGSAAAVAILATGGVMATATAASAAKGHAKLPTTLSIRNKVIAHSKHHSDAITGVLRSSHRKGVASETITLDSRAGAKRRWVVVTTGTTGTDGSVSFTVTPTTRTQYKLVFAGDSTHRGSHSNVISLRKA